MASGMYHVLSYLHEFNSLEMYMILDPWLLFRIKSLLFPTLTTSFRRFSTLTVRT